MWSKGICWIDDCRIPFVDDKDSNDACKSDKTKKTYNEDWGNTIFNYRRTGGNTQGRFPANILVCDDMLNDGNSGGSSYCSPTKYEYEMSNEKFNSGGRRTKTGIGDKGTNSRYYDIDKWFDKILNYE